MSLQQVYSNFTKYIEPGNTTFTIDNPNNVRDGIQRAFSFAYLDLLPDFVSEVADEENLDDKAVNPVVISYANRFVAVYTPEFLRPPEDKVMMKKFAVGKFKIAEVIKSLNHTFDDTKPLGLINCPGVFDWMHPNLRPFQNKAKELKAQVELIYDSLYDDEEENITPETHMGYLPKSVKDRAFVDAKLPTHPDIMQEVRVRLTLMPNTKITFSNAQIQIAMGFSEEQIGKRGTYKQFHIYNRSKRETKTIVAAMPPKLEAELLNPTSVAMSFLSTGNVALFELKSSYAKERHPETIVQELEDNCKEFTEITGYPISCRFTENRKLEFTFPNTDLVEYSVLLHDRIAALFNFKDRTVTKNNYISNESIGARGYNAERGLTLATVQVHDTGPLTITLLNMPSITTRGRSCQLMALLRPSGYMESMEKDFKPVASFPNNKQQLTFRIDRNSDQNNIIGLSWPVGCFVYGCVVGTPI